jgi:ATP-dependent protease HslVU (ClpYQ) peptidase subunit
VTTILADANRGVMVADSSISDGDRVWIGRKVWRIKGALIGFAGDCNEAELFLTWWRSGCADKPPKFTQSQALILSASGLSVFNVSTVAENVRKGVEAIGSGAKAAICVYEAIGYADPAAAVRLVCKHDAGSRPPVRTYRL